MDTNDPLAANLPRPTAARPLLGLTVLAVEDSRFASEALRLMSMRSGARFRRADCLRSARRHFQVYRPTVVIVDLGLPDGMGTELIAERNASQQRIDAIVAMSGDTHREAEAMAAGADAFLPKPIPTLGLFQERILSALPPIRRPEGPRQVDNGKVTPDQLAYRDDMTHVAELLSGRTDGATLDYVAQFLGGVAEQAADKALRDAAAALAGKRDTGGSTAPELTHLTRLVQNRLTDRIAI